MTRDFRWLFAVLILVALVGWPGTATAGPFAPAAGQPGSDAVSRTSPAIDAWATGFSDLVRGPLNASNPGLGNASFGAGGNATGAADATPANTTPVVSLGDGGRITLSFLKPIVNRFGPDLAVFENGFGDTFLELAFVEVSSDGTNFFRFAAQSLTQTTTQVGSFDPLDPTNLFNLAGKYRAEFGTPFDLTELAGVSPLLNVNNVQFVRIVDVVGAVGTFDPAIGTVDSLGNKINDPFPTAFASGGFDLDAVAVLHEAPEPASWLLLAVGAVGLLFKLRRCRTV